MSDTTKTKAAGMNIIEYQMQANDGLLKPAIIKYFVTNKDHPDTCPPDCAGQQSMKRAERNYGII